MLARNQKYFVYLQSKRKINYKIMLAMKKQLLLFVLMFLPVMASAEAVEIDGIYYYLNTGTREAEVGYDPDGYKGAVAIPDNVTHEGVEYSVKSIHECAFDECKELTSVIIGKNVMYIGEAAFYGCKNLTSLIIPNSVTTIDFRAFYNCSSLTSLTIPNSVTSIDYSAFNGCTSLTTIIVEDGNPKYDSRDNCNAIIETSSNTLITGCKNTIIPNSVISIGSSAFSRCTSLTSLNIPNCVTSIGNAAFYGCTGLTSLTIPNCVTSIGSSAFSSCSGLASIKVENGNPNYESPENCNVIIDKSSNTLMLGCKNTIIPNSVTSIGNGAFRSCSTLTSVVIPNSVTSIDDNAFMDCTNLASVIIGNSVKNLGANSFQGCTNLSSITIPNSVTSIGSSAVAGCNGLNSLIVEDGNPRYDSRDKCNAIIETSSSTLIIGCNGSFIPNSVISIGERAFYGCSRLKSLTIPNSVTSISKEAFNMCSGLSKVTIPENVTSIDRCAFWNTGLTFIIMETSNPFSGIDVFTSWTYDRATLVVPVGSRNTYQSTDGWNKFKTIKEFGEGGDIGQEIEDEGLRYKIGEDNTVSVIARRNSFGEAIGNDYSGDIVIPDHVDCVGVPYKVTSIEDEVFRDCNGLTSAVIPNSVNSIGKKVFRGCTNMKSVIIGNGVTSIGDAAFEYCWGLSSLTIPQSVTSIGIYAFSASHLMTIISEIENPYSITNNVFKEVPSYAKLIVPKGTKSKYQATDGWNRFTDIIEVGEEGSVMEVDGINYKIERNNTVSVTSGTSYSGNVDIPDQITAYGITYSVTSIEDYAFAECRSLTSVNIPNNVTSIGNYAFQNSGLTTLTIPKGVTTFLASPFAGCNSLSSIKVDSENSYYDSRDDCNAIISKSSNSLIAGCKTTIIPNSVTYIGNQAFMDCRGLTSITIPDGLTSIGNNAFSGCSNLASLTIPDCVNYIGYRAFYGTAWYNNQPDGLLYLGKVFYGYKGVMPADTKITIKDGTIGIAGYAFYGYSNLTSVTIPNGVTSIGGYAFRECTGLPSVTIPNSVTYIDVGAFRGCSALTSFTIPNGVTSLNLSSVLRDCSGLKSITIPNSVKDITRGGGTSLQGCNSLNCIISEIKDPFKVYSIFSSVPSDAKVIVPKGTKEAYQATDGWSRFTNIVEVKDGDANGDEEVNQADVENVESFIMGKAPNVFVRSAADMNGDQKIDVVDIVLMQNLINKE